MTDFRHQHPARPKFLNLFKIRMPVTALVSIFHRISGFLLFALLPLFIYWFGLSLRDTDGFRLVTSLTDSLVFKLLIWFIAVNVLYHLLAGIRFLFMDIDIGHALKAARFSAWLVLLVSVLLFALLALMMVQS